MTRSRILLVVTAALFAGWIGWLAHLALTEGRVPLTDQKPDILSRAQFLVSETDVIAHVDTLEQPITVEEVHFDKSKKGEDLVGKSLEVLDLARATGWTGPGSYILPLVPIKGNRYRVAGVPRSPGYPGGQTAPGSARIYPLTADSREQLDHIAKP
jgi:hypothetical protein